MTLNSELYDELYDLQLTSKLKVIHVIGPPKSGATITARVILQSPSIYGGIIDCFMDTPEKYRRYNDNDNYTYFNRGLRRVLELYNVIRTQRRNRIILVIKDASNVMNLNEFLCLTRFPNWRFVFTNRNYADQEASYAKVNDPSTKPNNFEIRMRTIWHNYNTYLCRASNAIEIDYEAPDFDSIFKIHGLKPGAISRWLNPDTKFKSAINRGSVPINSPWFETILKSYGWKPRPDYLDHVRGWTIQRALQEGDELWEVTGWDVIGGGGILEWCCSEDDAKNMADQRRKMGCLNVYYRRYTTALVP